MTVAGTPAASTNSRTASHGTLAASATSLRFGNVTAGSNSSQTLTLTNTGTAAITISPGAINGTGFSVVGGMSAVSIAAGQNHAFQVQFAPPTAGNVTGSISMVSDTTNSPLSISLSGTGMTALSIATQPANQSVTVGQAATFTVTATGNGTLTYQWNKNGIAIGGATSSTYTTPSAASSDSGAQFNVVVTDSSGNVTSNAATLTVTATPVAPSITTQPASQTVTAGQTATYTVTANGTAPLTYQWKNNGTAISGATSSAYTTPATSASDNGALFTVTVTNATGNVTSNAATLTVNVPPVITTQPASQTVTAGQTASFTVTATGAATLTYQWQKNGTPISAATSASYTTPATSASDNGALFTVTVTNATGNVTSNAATLTVNVPPVITTQPASQTVTAGQTASFTVTATGAATLTYQWQKNGTAISGATAASYTTPATAAADNGGLFSVAVTNSTGTVTSSAATLTVNLPPAITTQPVNQTVTSGQTATFMVAATSTATLTYQWKKNGIAISGATATSYTTPATTISDNGAQFTVTVTNVAGNITSNAATLTVNAATFLLNASTTSLNFANVNLGSNSILSVTFTNAGNSNVTVSGVSISGAGYAASGVSTGQIVTPGQVATLNVTFTPAAAGSLPGTVTVTSNATNSPATVSLSGTGVQPVAHSVTLSWTASTSTVSGYNAYRSSVSSGPYTKLNSALITTTQYTDSTVVAGQTYFYMVTSVDSSNVESTDSNQISTTVPTP